VITRRPSAEAKLGYRSAVLATVLGVAYVLAQLAEWLGLLGSRGGPESASTPLGLALLLTPSLLLGSTFLVLTVCVRRVAPPDRRVYGEVAVAFATAYAVLVSLVYFVQLTLVAPRLARGDTAGIEAFVFVPFDSFLYAVDILGYAFMSVSTLFAARVFAGGGPERVARGCLLANGLLLPFLVFQMYYPPLIWVASLWAVTFPGSTASLALLFARGLGNDRPAGTRREVKAMRAATGG
jgi:hypothetical protein